MSCGVGCRRGLDPVLLWLWHRPVATAPIQPLVWEPPYAAGAAQEIATTKRDKKKKKRETRKAKVKPKQVLWCPKRVRELVANPFLEKQTLSIWGIPSFN